MLKIGSMFTRFMAALWSAKMAERARDFRFARSYYVHKNGPTPPRLHRIRLRGQPPMYPNTARMLFKAGNRGFRPPHPSEEAMMRHDWFWREKAAQS